MAFSERAPRLGGALGFSARVWIRAVLIGLFAFLAILAGGHGLYATTMVLAVAAVLVGFDLARSADVADRLMAHFVDGLVAEGDDRPRPAAGAGRLAGAIERALDRLAFRRAEAQRRADFAEALADNVLAALLVADATGAVTAANRAARQLLGEVEGPLEAIGGLSLDGRRTLAALAPGGRSIVQLGDGRALLASVTGFSAPGRGASRLIALQALSGDLDPVVLKAWRDLAQVLAHEMMNSLTPICSLSDSVAERLRGSSADPSGELSAALEVISRRGAGLMSFVERYRKLSDLPPAILSSVPAAALIDRLEQLMGPMMRGVGVDYSGEVMPTDLSLDADPELLEQALINLLKNALDAVAGRAEPMVRLVLQREETQVAIRIEDNGPGLSGDDAEAAFTPFFSRKAGGSGVGLTLARQIALAHGGRLDYAPRPGGGARFTLSLPTLDTATALVNGDPSHQETPTAGS
jgi:nitrogen fixation/metabolism regulation signal transduction histidine kinase